MVKTGNAGEWSVKDILSHIAAWEKNFLSWYEAGVKGAKVDKPDFSKSGVLDEVNRQIYESNRRRRLEDVTAEFKDSYKRILTVVESIPEEVLFAHGKFSWTRRLTVAEYIVANTGEHYAEHLAAVKAIKQQPGK
jgi:hypothetical protein